MGWRCSKGLLTLQFLVGLLLVGPTSSLYQPREVVTRLRSEATPSTRAFDYDFPSSTAESFWFWLFAPFPPVPPNHSDPNPVSGERAPRPCAVAERGASTTTPPAMDEGYANLPTSHLLGSVPVPMQSPTRFSASLVSLGIVADLGWFVSAGCDTGRQETQSPRRPRL